MCVCVVKSDPAGDLTPCCIDSSNYLTHTPTHVHIHTQTPHIFFPLFCHNGDEYFNPIRHVQIKLWHQFVFCFTGQTIKYNSQKKPQRQELHTFCFWSIFSPVFTCSTQKAPTGHWLHWLHNSCVSSLKHTFAGRVCSTVLCKQTLCGAILYACVCVHCRSSTGM